MKFWMTYFKKNSMIPSENTMSSSWTYTTQTQSQFAFCHQKISLNHRWWDSRCMQQVRFVNNREILSFFTHCLKKRKNNREFLENFTYCFSSHFFGLLEIMIIFPVIFNRYVQILVFFAHMFLNRCKFYHFLHLW